MRYKVADLKREVRIAIDQNMASVQLSDLGDIDTLSLEDIIESKIADAARIVEQNAAFHLLDRGRAFADSIGWNAEPGIGSGHIHLPDDFLRLLAFQMSDWSYPVTTAIDESNPLYKMQASRFPGIRGCPQKPVVAITQQPIGLVLEFYSCTAGKDVYVKRARYIPIPQIRKGHIEICEKLKSAIIYYAGYLTALSINNVDLAKNMLVTSKELST